MPSELQLVNRCLAELGRPSIVAISDSEDAQYVDNKINELYPELLLEYNWNFAVIYRSDDTPLVDNFSPDFVYTYQLPGDFGKFYRWASSGSQWPFYQIVDGLLLAQTKPIQYYYIKNYVDFQYLPPLFSRMLILYAAAKSSLVLTNNVQLTAYLENEYTKIRTRAIEQNDMERSVMSMPYNDFDRLTFV